MKSTLNNINTNPHNLTHPCTPDRNHNFAAAATFPCHGLRSCSNSSILGFIAGSASLFLIAPAQMTIKPGMDSGTFMREEPCGQPRKSAQKQSNSRTARPRYHQQGNSRTREESLTHSPQNLLSSTLPLFVFPSLYFLILSLPFW